MRYIVTYDIPDDRRRNRLAKTLLDFGIRVQYSVFECLLEADTRKKLDEAVQTVIDVEEDGVRIYPLCGNCEKNTRIIGIGEMPVDPDVYIL
jgi:CRISPR-associated protein Cas2